MIDKKLLSILVCPVSKAPLEYFPEQQELICWASGLAYPIRDDIPVMLENEARSLSQEEIALHKKNTPSSNSQL
ncbi:MAG TPA: Trm112 family protein [Cellvibrio sp.]|nr:Trm112 family protein [Cellvibrio sp.]